MQGGYNWLTSFSLWHCQEISVNCSIIFTCWMLRLSASLFRKQIRTMIISQAFSRLICKLRGLTDTGKADMASYENMSSCYATLTISRRIEGLGSCFGDDCTWKEKSKPNWLLLLFWPLLFLFWLLLLSSSWGKYPRWAWEFKIIFPW